ncbi:uncharacterized protein K460DRAFT_329128 [Cucurbitaria berberidis CBS 394.84]|uniref:Uncharacterized protein n=1 Tax=Cucurbitaria berberidis CBS 394.84 TaxID=1168544 RepID=A0A9P4GRK0_9PLEO|nr:uncharacterized protein K460DRAFT_329128 [Cucurbitaria berberidis CBS 394.84]KAF1851278.1 hypothetical protein K460DRAFT_329128 [Cucurbitaria berberidis CBS 394.84]
MAAMFRNFSFDPVSPPAYSVYEAERAAMNVSPTSRPTDPLQLSSNPSPPTPPCTMGDLAVQLNQQTLFIEPRANHDAARPSTKSKHCASPIDQRKQQARPTYSRVATSVLRMQRQSSSRLQCCSSHVRDISKLVRMIEAEEQCTINEPTSQPSSTTSSTLSTSGDDEGIDMDYDVPARAVEALIGMPQWRAGHDRDRCIRVTKQVRMRKRSKPNGVTNKASPSSS